MHEYLTVYDNSQSYGQCIECNKRTPHICLKCNYCYSCHPKIESIEKDQAKKLIKYRYIRNNTAEERGQGQLPPVTFVTYAITKTKTKTSKK
ncbi:MAG: hypothetical protein WAM14_25130 [Candidatus Nitrosopolaris sp.]